MRPLFLTLLLLVARGAAPAPQAPPRVVTGQIMGINGAPAANLRVSAMEVNDAAAEGTTPALVGFAQTDAQGRYRIENLQPGRYYILAGPLESPTFYPGTADRSRASVVSLTAQIPAEVVNFGLSRINQSGLIQVVAQRLDTRGPIANALVTLRRATSGSPALLLTQNTDAAGQVTFGELAPGQYNATVEAEGYLASGPARGFGGNPSAASAPLTLTAEQNEARAVMTLNPASVLVMDSVPGQTALIPTLMQMSYFEGRRVLAPLTASRGRLGSDGRVRFDVAPGEYYLRSAALRANGPQAGTDSVMVAYYPGVADPSKAKPISVSGATTIVPGFSAPREGFTISGTVTNPVPGGRQNPNGVVNRSIASFSVVPRDKPALDANPPLIQNTARNIGPGNTTAFEIRGIPSGDYDLYPLFTDGSGIGGYFTARTPIHVGNANVTGLSITLQPHAELKGRFAVEGDASQVQWNGVRAELRPMEVLPTLVRGPNRNIPLTVDAGTGALTLADLPETRMSVLVTGLPANLYVADLRQGGRSVFGEGVATVGGGPFEIVVKSGAATVSGTLKDRPSTAAPILLRPVSGNLHLYKRGRARATGQFNLFGVAPGEYTLYAFESLPTGGADENDEFMASFATQGRRVSIKEGETLRVDDLLMIPDPAVAAPTVPAGAGPQITNRIIRSADTPIVTADGPGKAPGLRGGGGGGFASTGAFAAGRGNRGAVAPATPDPAPAAAPASATPPGR